MNFKNVERNDFHHVGPDKYQPEYVEKSNGYEETDVQNIFEKMQREIDELKSYKVGTRGSVMAFFKWDVCLHTGNFITFSLLF